MELQRADLDWVKQRYGVVMMRLVYELRGVSCLPLELVAPPKKSLMVSRSFGAAVTELAELKGAIATFVTRAAEKLRRYQLNAGVMSVFAATNWFQEGYYSNTATVSLMGATNDTPELLRYVMECAERLYRPGLEFRKVGVLMQALTLQQTMQMALWDERDRPRHRALMQAVDAINGQFGAGTVRFGVQGFQQSWKLKAMGCSPRYTTWWEDVLGV